MRLCPVACFDPRMELEWPGPPAPAPWARQIEPTIATVDDTAVPDRLSISCHLLAVQIGCSLSAQQVPLCLTLQRVSRPFLRVTFFKASWAGTADSRRRRRQYLFSACGEGVPDRNYHFENLRITTNVDETISFITELDTLAWLNEHRTCLSLIDFTSTWRRG